MEIDNMILDVEARQVEGGIRLKYLAIAGGCGPEIRMPFSLAKKTITTLQQALEEDPESNSICKT